MEYVNYAVPQGSTFGAIFFSIYTKYLCIGNFIDKLTFLLITQLYAKLK